jgi:ABC-type transport system substrate-binding protein
MRAVSLRWLVLPLGACLSCSGPPAATTGSEGASVLHYAQVGSVTTLDPARAGWTVESRVIEQMAEGLTDVDASLQIRAALADSWEVTEGGRTFRFRLRKGATLGDGRPLRSHDVAAALTRLAAPGDLAGWAVMADVAGAAEYRSGRAEGVSGLETPDPGTLVVRLVSPSGRFLYQLATASAVVFAGASSEEDWPRGRVPGTGPFRLESLQEIGGSDLRRQRLVFRARNGALQPPRIGGMVWDLYATAADLKRGLGRESYDVVSTSDPDEASFSRALSRHTLRHTLSLGFLSLYFDCQKPPLDRPAARRAIALGADREALGASDLLPGFRLPGALGPSSADAVLRRDPEAAKALAARAGLDPRRPTALRVAYSRSFEYGDLSGWIRGAFSRSLEPLGLRVEAVEAPGSAALDRRFTARLDHAYLFGSFPDTMDPCLVLEPFRSRSTAFNWSWYSRPEVDEDYQACARSHDVTSQQRAIDHALRLVAQDAPLLPLTLIRQRVYVGPRVVGFVPSPLEGMDFRTVALRSEP